MASNISVVINTLNEEKNIGRAIRSASWADEILVCDMYSEDKTVEVAKKMGAKVVYHKKVGYVEPARNFAISKASNDWVLILDADEEISTSLKEKIREMVSKPIKSDFVQIPRKNIIFGRWMRASLWWPDYQIRLFKKGFVEWSDQIHRPPKTSTHGLKLLPEEKWAIIHHHYQTISQFVERMNRYTTIEADELRKVGYRFKWTDLIQKPLDEFLSRFFANKGYLDGLHGLSLSLFQACSFLVVYLKVWEIEKYKEADVSMKEMEILRRQSTHKLDWWFNNVSKRKSFWKKFKQKFF